MPGFLLPRFTFTEARNTVLKNCKITFEKAQNGSDTDMTRLLVVYSNGKKFTEPIKTKKTGSDLIRRTKCELGCKRHTIGSLFLTYWATATSFAYLLQLP